MSKKTVNAVMVSSIEDALKYISFPDELKQVNSITGLEYKKVNKLILIASIRKNEFSSNEWFTEKQIEQSNLSIKEDAEGTILFSFRIEEVENKKVRKSSYYRVFNKNQIKETF